MPDYRIADHRPRLVDRRGFLETVGGGFGAMALSAMMGEEKARAAGTFPNFPPKSKRVIQIFVSGGMSQVDTFDYKPELFKRAGKAFEPGGKVELFESVPGQICPSYWPL